MEGVKGSLTAKYYTKGHNYGPTLTLPRKIITTSTTTEQIIADMTTTTAETITKIKEVLTDIFTNTNKTQENDDNTRNLMNNTIADEILGSNATSILNNNETSTISTILSVTEGNILRNNITILNATEEIDNSTVTDNVFDYITSTVSNTISDDHHNDMYTTYNKTSYIIMGVLVAILICIGIGLIGVYFSYKKKNSAHISGQYNHRASREIPMLDQQSKC